jgi:hypothetical protein
MKICRCRPCRLGIIGGCVAARLTAGYSNDVDAPPPAALAGVTLTSTAPDLTTSVSSALADEIIRLPPIPRRAPLFERRPLVIDDA